MAFSAVYYMTNYATKYDVSQHQLILTAAILKRAGGCQIGRRPVGDAVTDQTLQAFNRLSSDREISGPQAASSRAVSLAILISMPPRLDLSL
jgi:hypothetical protein